MFRAESPPQDGMLQDVSDGPVYFGSESRSRDERLQATLAQVMEEGIPAACWRPLQRRRGADSDTVLDSGVSLHGGELTRLRALNAPATGMLPLNASKSSGSHCCVGRITGTSHCPHPSSRSCERGRSRCAPLRNFAVVLRHSRTLKADAQARTTSAQEASALACTMSLRPLPCVFGSGPKTRCPRVWREGAGRRRGWLGGARRCNASARRLAALQRPENVCPGGAGPAGSCQGRLRVPVLVRRRRRGGRGQQQRQVGGDGRERV
jgi:hypothetical protein